MQTIIKPPSEVDFESIDTPIIFLAGSIEMGAAENWQERISNDIEDTGIPHTILNPRRDDWDDSWEQSINNPQFKEQVSWELDGIEQCDIVAFYFDPDTKSPITLLEMGSVIDSGKEVVICCPDGYWRKGNVEVVADRAGFTILNSYDEFKSILIDKVLEFYEQD